MQSTQSAILFYQSVCLSVCVSNAGTVSKRMDVSSHFFDILVFFDPPPLQYSNGNSPSGGAKYKVVGKFSKYRLLSRKRYEIVP